MRRSASVLMLLDHLRFVWDGNPGRDGLSVAAHSAQTARRAELDGADDELVLVALLHDVFRLVAPVSHGEAAAVALGDRLSPGRVEVLRHHSLFQHDLLHGTDRAAEYRGAGWFGDGVRLAAWDGASFDVGFRTPEHRFYARLVERFLDG